MVLEVGGVVGGCDNAIDIDLRKIWRKVFVCKGFVVNNFFLDGFKVVYVGLGIPPRQSIQKQILHKLGFRQPTRPQLGILKTFCVVPDCIGIFFFFG